MGSEIDECRVGNPIQIRRAGSLVVLELGGFELFGGGVRVEWVGNV